MVHFVEGSLSSGFQVGYKVGPKQLVVKSVVNTNIMCLPDTQRLPPSKEGTQALLLATIVLYCVATRVRTPGRVVVYSYNTQYSNRVLE
jgi:hypothetical protein